MRASCLGKNLRRGGIKGAFDKLVEIHGRRVMRLLLAMLGHRQDAEDCWQETWYAIWRARGRLAPGRDPWPFIRTAAIHKAQDRLRRQPAGRLPLLAEPAQPAVVTPENHAWALQRLPQGERAALVLFFWEELSVLEIAEVLKVPEGTVKTWMRRGRQRLRGWMLQGREVS